MLAGNPSFIGAFCNYLALITNKGLMPVSLDPKLIYLYELKPPRGYEYVNSHTKFAFLGDWIPIHITGVAYPIALISPGDILILSTVLFFILVVAYEFIYKNNRI